MADEGEAPLYFWTKLRPETRRAGKKNVLGTHPKGLDPALIIVIKNGSNRPGFSIL